MLVLVETFYADSEKSSSPIRVRPVAGQGLSPQMRVECSKRMRYSFPVGQKFLLEAKIVRHESGSSFLYSNYRDKWFPVDEKEAQAFIQPSENRK
jgi:hypothetical protein